MSMKIRTYLSIVLSISFRVQEGEKHLPGAALIHIQGLRAADNDIAEGGAGRLNVDFSRMLLPHIVLVQVADERQSRPAVVVILPYRAKNDESLNKNNKYNNP